MGCLVSIQEDTVGVVESGGKFCRLLFPGVHFLTPVFEVMAAVVSLRERNCSLELELNTKEFALVKFKVNAQYKVRDEPSGELIASDSNVHKAYYKVHDDLEAKLLEYMENNLRGQFRSCTLLQAFSKGEEIARLLLEEADAEMHQYGFTVFHVGISDMTSQRDPAQLAAEMAAAAAAASAAGGGHDGADPSAAEGTGEEMFLDQCVYDTLEKHFNEKNLLLVSALQIVKMQRKFGRDPARRILVITKSKPDKGPIKVEMHSFKRETEEEASTLTLFAKKLAAAAPKTEAATELSKEDRDDGSYTLIRTYPLVRMKDVTIQDGMFVLSFEDKTPDLCISSLNARQVTVFINEAIRTCQEASGPEKAEAPSQQTTPPSSHSKGSARTPPAAKPPALAPTTPNPTKDSGMFGQTKAAMEKNKQALEERGERLRNMGDQSAEMAEQAADFLAAVRRMRQQQESKKWYEL